MGAVKTNRRILINPHYHKGAIYFRKSLYERADKGVDRIIQSFGLVGEPYKEVNNRRKMHGQPLIRRVMS